MDKLLIKQLIFHGSWLVFPFILWALWRLRRARNRVQQGAAVLLIVASLTFVWARFIEPQWMHTRHSTLQGSGARLDLVLISDLHLGLYKSPDFLARLVKRINAIEADAVLIAGDFTYESATDEVALSALFAPLAGLKKPVFAVLGNHDQQAPGPDIDLALRAALQAHGIDIIEGQSRLLAPGITLAGLGDNWAGKDSTRHLAENPQTTVLVLAHNPDSAEHLQPGQTALLMAGHTHGGQVRIPWLYRKVIPSRYGFDRGEAYFQHANGKIRVYTSAGLGEVGLPLRFLNPPVIDVLHLRD